RIFAQHEYSSPAQIEELLHRYAPQTQQAANTQELIRLIGEHTHRVTLDWVQGNALSGLPLDMISLIPIPEEVDAGQGAHVGTGIQMAGRALYSLGRVFSSTLGGIFRKPKTKASVKSHNPAKVMQQLGTGQKLGASARKQMEGAFGSNFSQVEVHTDQTAAQLATDMNARAFTVGNHVAFGSGEYRPGTLVGDALLAHELAHVEQQKEASLQAQTKLEMGGAEYNALEQEADLSAFNTVNYIFDKKYAKSIQKKAKIRLHIQRCSKDKEQNQELEEAKQYLNELIKNKTISQKKSGKVNARLVINFWKAGYGQFLLSPQLKVLLIKELIHNVSGFIPEEDQSLIVHLIKGTGKQDLEETFKDLAEVIILKFLTGNTKKDFETHVQTMKNSSINSSDEIFNPDRILELRDQFIENASKDSGAKLDCITILRTQLKNLYSNSSEKQTVTKATAKSGNSRQVGERMLGENTLPNFMSYMEDYGLTVQKDKFVTNFDRDTSNN
ncbi:MAG: DUF4157 domain-containing protein, partial [Microscillaceae bacterium]|nr:DUF4157 domain-containing protein [Microscillaceae bacterium]